MGNAAEWYRGFLLGQPQPSWPLLVSEIKARFVQRKEINAADSFKKVKRNCAFGVEKVLVDE